MESVCSHQSEDDTTKSEESNSSVVVYQELAPPWLLYQHKTNVETSAPPWAGSMSDAQETFSPPWAATGYKTQKGQTPSDLHAKLVHSSIQRTHRAQARWYYPVDFPVVKEALEGKPRKKRKRKEKAQDRNKGKGDYTYPYSVRPQLLRQARDWNALDPVMDEKFLNARVLECLDGARKAMMTSCAQDDNDDCTSYATRKSQSRRLLLRQHQKYDSSYIPAQWKLYQNYNSLEEPKLYLKDDRCNGSFYFSQQRLDSADPRYLSPFPMDCLHKILEADMPAKEKKLRKQRAEEDYDPRDTTHHRQDSFSYQTNPSHYGNCIACIPCSCPACSSANQEDAHSNWCLLHPVGDCLDVLAASLVTPPNGLSNGALLRTRRNVSLQMKSHRTPNTYNEIGLGDRIRQIEKCTHHIFLVRTSIHVTIVSVTPHEDDTLPIHKEKYRQVNLAASSDSLCWGTFELTELQRIDLRSRLATSYCPVDVTSHKKFVGSVFTNHQYKFAMLSHSLQERNVIHHFLWSDSRANNLYTKHVVGNLKNISQIAFRSPMIMYASAVAWVRPNLVPDCAMRQNDTKARFGPGHSLYTIDLKTNLATFQWSPSSAEFLSEGSHSITGFALMCSETELWAYSISAGKMWELDVNFLPMRIINCWTLPGQCNSCGPCLPPLGALHGAGRFIMVQLPGNENSKAPVVSVGIGPGANGVHLYQRPSARPHFQTENLECVMSTALSLWKEHKFATSDVFGSGEFFGIAPVCLPATAFVSSEQGGLASDTLDAVTCVITMNASGNIYSHALVSSKSKSLFQDAALLRNGAWSASNNKGEDEVPGNTATQAEGKLAGGMNLVLGIAKLQSLPQQKIVGDLSGNKLNKQGFVRPFQYSNLSACQLTEPTVVAHASRGTQLVSSACESAGNYFKSSEVSLQCTHRAQAETAHKRSDVTTEVLDLLSSN